MKDELLLSKAFVLEKPVYVSEQIHEDNKIVEFLVPHEEII
jgi:hypothetical protein